MKISAMLQRPVEKPTQEGRKFVSIFLQQPVLTYSVCQATTARAPRRRLVCGERIQRAQPTGIEVKFGGLAPAVVA